jgi:hypothetical protein
VRIAEQIRRVSRIDSLRLLEALSEGRPSNPATSPRKVPARPLSTLPTPSPAEPSGLADVDSYAAKYRKLEKRAAETTAEYQQLGATHVGADALANTGTESAGSDICRPARL